MAIVNGIGAILHAIINGVVAVLDTLISCLTCGHYGRGRRMGTTGRRHHGTTSRI